jgi:type IV pilus assembly protein PilM
MAGGPTVGLDIGSRWIKVAEVAPGRNGVVVRALGLAPTPEGAMENNIVVDAKLLGDAVKKLLKEAGISSRRSVSSVSGQGALVVRVIEVPILSDAELAETMRWEVERHVPFAANEVIMDFQPIERPDTPPDAQNMEVLLAVAQQDMIDKHVEVLFAAGLKPAAIDVEPLAAARCLIELGPDPYGKKTTCIVNIGASNTDIGIYRDGILAFPRTLPLAGDSLTRAIMSQLGVQDFEQAEDLKIRHGEVVLDTTPPSVQPVAADAPGFLDFSVGPVAAEPVELGPFEVETGPNTEPTAEPVGGDVAFDLGVETPAPAAPVAVPSGSSVDPQTMQVFAAMAPVLGELLQELQRSLDYYRGRSPDGRVDEVLLCGGSSRLRNLDQFLAAELRLPVRVADPFQNAPAIAKNVSAEYLQQVGPSFAVAVGLAARDLVAGPAPVKAGGKKRGKK